MSGFETFLGISASAGSGKTHALAHRFLQLLALEAAADSIGAYTFSRKAAGEIFDEIVKYLRLAAASEAAAARTSRILGLTRSSSAFLQDLRALLGNLHRLRIGTLDSRIAQMLSAASIEIGLPPHFGLLDGDSPEAIRLREQTMDTLFLPGRLPEASTRLFLDLFELATFGQAEKSFDRKLHHFIGAYRSTLLAIPDPEAWQGPPIDDAPRPLPDAERRALAAAIHASAETEIPDKRCREALLKLLDACAAFDAGTAWSSLAWPGTLGTQILDGETTLLYYKKSSPLSPSFHAQVLRLLQHPPGVVWERCCTQTPALHGLLRVYDAAYRLRSLPRGQLTFEDACSLMAGFSQLAPGDIAFRLDGDVAHWMLDEFQDTSRAQWEVVRPFVEEILQDPTHQRSFFYVGDVKQAIYAWRGGAAELFNEIREQWPDIQTQQLNTSYRSAPAVLELVNTLFANIPVPDGFPSAAAARWNREFSPHVAAKQELGGYATLQRRLTDESEVAEEILAILNTTPPQAEVAILTRGNEEGREIADALRAAGKNVALEGSTPLRDDSAVEAVLAALRLAAHPADDFSRQFTRLAGLGELNAFDLLTQLQHRGFASVIRDLIHRLDLLPDAAFSRHRLEKLSAQAAAFDALGDASVDRFLQHIDGARLREHESRGVIRIMTIHQSKGLGFDVVILPVNKGTGFVRVEANQMVSSQPDEDPAWVTLLPPKEVCEWIPELREIREREEAISAYESLCTLYVALTRAKQALHVLLPPAPASKEPSLNLWHNWIADRIGGPDATWGDPHWLCAPSTAAAATAPCPFPLRPGSPVIPRLEPSRADAHPERIDRLFALNPQDGRELGQRVHNILQNITWSDDCDAEALLAAAGETPDSDAAAHLRRALRFPQLHSDPASTGLWREQRFETILSDGWITGIFDRVVLYPDRALIQDYKTNRRSDPDTVAHYAPQMQLYRRVLADMLSLAPERIRCQLLFTGTGEVHEL